MGRAMTGGPVAVFSGGGTGGHLYPALALADAFDVTMTVVGQDESFDETVVNRIALPFGQATSNRMSDDHTGIQCTPDSR